MILLKFSDTKIRVVLKYGYKGQYKVSHASPNIVPDGPMGILDLYQKRDRGAHCYQAVK